MGGFLKSRPFAPVGNEFKEVQMSCYKDELTGPEEKQEKPYSYCDGMHCSLFSHQSGREPRQRFVSLFPIRQFGA